MIDGRICFHQPVNHKERKYYNTQKIVNDRGDDFMTSCLLDCHYFKDHQKIILIDLSKQKALDAAPKAIQKFNFSGSLKANVTIVSILEDIK